MPTPFVAFGDCDCCDGGVCSCCLGGEPQGIFTEWDVTTNSTGCGFTDPVRVVYVGDCTWINEDLTLKVQRAGGFGWTLFWWFDPGTGPYWEEAAPIQGFDDVTSVFHYHCRTDEADNDPANYATNPLFITWCLSNQVTMTPVAGTWIPCTGA